MAEQAARSLPRRMRPEPRARPTPRHEEAEAYLELVAGPIPLPLALGPAAAAAAASSTRLASPSAAVGTLLETSESELAPTAASTDANAAPVDAAAVAADAVDEAEGSLRRQAQLALMSHIELLQTASLQSLTMVLRNLVTEQAARDRADPLGLGDVAAASGRMGGDRRSASVPPPTGSPLASSCPTTPGAPTDGGANPFDAAATATAAQPADEAEPLGLSALLGSAMAQARHHGSNGALASALQTTLQDRAKGPQRLARQRSISFNSAMPPLAAALPTASGASVTPTLPTAAAAAAATTDAADAAASRPASPSPAAVTSGTRVRGRSISGLRSMFSGMGQGRRSAASSPAPEAPSPAPLDPPPLALTDPALALTPAGLAPADAAILTDNYTLASALAGLIIVVYKLLATNPFDRMDIVKASPAASASAMATAAAGPSVGPSTDTSIRGTGTGTGGAGGDAAPVPLSRVASQTAASTGGIVLRRCMDVQRQLVTVDWSRVTDEQQALWLEVDRLMVMVQTISQVRRDAARTAPAAAAPLEPASPTLSMATTAAFPTDPAVFRGEKPAAVRVGAAWGPEHDADGASLKQRSSQHDGDRQGRDTADADDDTAPATGRATRRSDYDLDVVLEAIDRVAVLAPRLVDQSVALTERQERMMAIGAITRVLDRMNRHQGAFADQRASPPRMANVNDLMDKIVRAGRQYADQRVTLTVAQQDRLDTSRLGALIDRADRLRYTNQESLSRQDRFLAEITRLAHAAGEPRRMNDQRFTITPQKEREMFLGGIANQLARMGERRMDAQCAHSAVVTREKAWNDVDQLLDRFGRMDDSRALQRAHARQAPSGAPPSR
ncbi:hypothetical protein CXG81DRAFT_24466 [Caulochytrium protostelioides]|uniref:Uncharacterized protein n=1 Tax=Caulochytrium protostelioides TaxID=1555241 RepID=A0A4P9XBT7_9FUNG|nr:hypothetical protein CXG81DRAFT_24466 [Caulochytrium protostelioides]|eukprot:RKP02866.1 hypothetical protein CXG81DRAFT_24466 [Caulochytrium protostelioides]